MMIDKRLISVVPKSKRYIAASVIYQWIALIANIALVLVLSLWFESFLRGGVNDLFAVLVFCVAMILIRFVCLKKSGDMNYFASREVKQILREKIYQKLLKIGPSYGQKTSTSEVVQIASEGVEQLETYFGAYLPQFFYSMLAPITLFIAIFPISVWAAVVLFLCVPLIPISIAAVQTFAKKLLSKYWGQYTSLGDHFLENLQGLTTLKIYTTDALRHEQMNEEAEKFRKITMRVLTMQLNSITIMDIVAFGGAAIGMIIAISQYLKGEVPFAGAFAVVLLSADFFLPMRLLGSFFHIAMNGMAASEKIFRLLDLPVSEEKPEKINPNDCTVQFQNVHFSYDDTREILHGVNLTVRQNTITALVGVSGCGKSTISALIAGRNQGYTGSITLSGKELSELSEQNLLQHITTVGTACHLFKGTVRENLLLGNPKASDDDLWNALEQVQLAGFLKEEQGLDTKIAERASNLSGGQRQRMALARALLHDSEIYIFDEATSNIDVESEDVIMNLITKLAHQKTILLISHRLANITRADNIYVIEQGNVVEEGNHTTLLESQGVYYKLWNQQKQLEEIGKEVHK